MKLIGNLIYHKEWIMLNACHSVYMSYRYIHLYPQLITCGIVWYKCFCIYYV